MMAVQIVNWTYRSIYKQLPEFQQFLSTFAVLPDSSAHRKFILAHTTNRLFQTTREN